MENIKKNIKKTLAIGIIASGLTYVLNFSYYAIKGVYLENNFYYNTPTGRKLNDNLEKQIIFSEERYKITNNLEKELETYHGYILHSSVINALEQKLHEAQSQLQELEEKQKPFEDISLKIAESQEYKSFRKEINTNIIKMFNPFYTPNK